MFHSPKILILFLFFETSVFFLSAQDLDSLPSAKGNYILNDSLARDSISPSKKKEPENNFSPDTVFLVNGDKITGNIISFENDRLKIDAQGAGVINIKEVKILSVSGGSRLFKVEDVRHEIYTGPVRFSKDTGEILLINKYTYGILFTDIIRMAPLDEKSSSSIPDSTVEIKTDQSANNYYLPDTVFLKTGDQLTGKILAFEQGRLKMDAQGAGVIYIKWLKIASINGGNRLFKVEDIRGEIYIGRIALSKDTGEVLVLSQLKYGIMFEDMVRMFPLEEEWYRGFKGDMGAGLNYTKSSEVLNLNADYNLYYVISKWRFINNLSYIQTSTDKSDPSVRIEFDLQALYALPRKWVLSEINSFNRNDELGIDSRISFGLGAGNSLVLTEKQRLIVLTGISQNSEKDIESNNVSSNFEWPVSLQHTIYSFIAPNLTSTTKLASFVGITEKGRYRADASTDLTWEFITHVKFKFSIYYSYDNKILTGKNSSNDYGTTISLTFDLR
jgi:sRNA-binding regulator protein Hfq